MIDYIFNSLLQPHYFSKLIIFFRAKNVSLMTKLVIIDVTLFMTPPLTADTAIKSTLRKHRSCISIQ
jgi:hypothetical protein